MTSFRKNSDSKINGRWTTEEHRLFIEGLAKHGKDWKKIEDLLKTRDGAQIRSHAQKFFLRMTKEYKRMMKTGKYDNRIERLAEISKEEEDKLYEAGSSNNSRSFNMIEKDVHKEDYGLNKGSNNEEIKVFNKEETDRKDKGLDMNEKGIILNQRLFNNEEIQGKNLVKSNLQALNYDEKHKKNQNDELERLEKMERIRKAFEFYVICLSLNENPIIPDNNEIKNHDSFFHYLQKNMISNDNPLKIRKLSDLVEFPSEIHTQPIRKNTGFSYKRSKKLMPLVERKPSDFLQKGFLQNNKEILDLKPEKRIHSDSC